MAVTYLLNVAPIHVSRGKKNETTKDAVFST